MKILEVQKLRVRRRHEWILEDIDLEFQSGEIVGLAGPNGAGKSTLFEALLGFIPSDAKQLAWKAGLRKAYLPQHQAQVRDLPLTVASFVELGTWGATSNVRPLMQVSEALEWLNLKGIQSKRVSFLSGGEWKRALLARTFVQAAECFLLDEPFNDLDLEAEHRIVHRLRDWVKAEGRSIIVISHDWHALDECVDRMMILNRRIVASGSVAEMNQFYLRSKNPEHHQWMHPKHTH